MASNPVHKLTEEEYLALERAAESKSEFLNGETFAMSGVSMQHARIERNLLTELTSLLSERDCEAFPSNLRVKVGASGGYFYPDVSVVCGEPMLADHFQDILLNPIVIVEVLSPSTEKYDRGLKFQHYVDIASLKDYILIEQGKTLIEHYTRRGDGLWDFRFYRNMEEELKILSIGVAIHLHKIYERVKLA
jgi:Uma2 family endonuclease